MIYTHCLLCFASHFTLLSHITCNIFDNNTLMITSSASVTFSLSLLESAYDRKSSWAINFQFERIQYLVIAHITERLRIGNKKWTIKFRFQHQGYRPYMLYAEFAVFMQIWPKSSLNQLMSIGKPCLKIFKAQMFKVLK